MTFKLDHMCSIVHDMDTNINFYTNILGGQVTSYKLLKDEKIVFVQVCEHFIQLVEPKIQNSSTQYGLNYLAFETDDLENAYNYLLDLGYIFENKPQLSAGGNGKFAFLKDPNGVNVKLIQRDIDIHRQAKRNDFLCSFDHYAVKSHDLNSAHKFYHEHLKMGNLAHFVIGDNIREIMYLDSGTATLEIVQSGEYKLTDNPHSHIAFRVNDIAKMCRKLNEFDILISENNIKPAGMKTGLTISFPDPEGTRIEIVDRCDLRNLSENGYTLENLSTMRPF